MITVINKDYTAISVDDLIQHLNLDDDLINTTHLEGLITASVDWIDARINGFIVPTSLEFNTYDFTGDTIIIEHKNFDNITSLKIAETEYPDYKVRKGINYTKIILDEPVIEKSDIQISYLAGTRTPKHYLQAALIVAADMFDTDRSNYSTGLTDNRTVMRLLNLE